MKNWIYKIFVAAITSAAIYSCTPEIDVPAPSSGGADFTKYVAVGNSLTAGFADNGLYAEGQANSFPMMIAEQMSSITPSEFIQPDIPGNGSGYIYLTSLDLSGATPEVDIGQFEADASWLNQIEGPFNNFGVPGIRVKDITVAGYGSSPQVNPYFYRMLGAKDPNTSYLSFVAESNPTFFTCWLGNNDVLGYATSGGAFGVDGLPGTGLYGFTDPEAEFRPSYDALMNALISDGAKGVVLTIPDVTNIPFFTTIPWNGVELSSDTAALATYFYSYSIDTATMKQVETAVFLGAATQQVYETAYQQAIDGGATPTEAQAIAEEYIESTEGQANIDLANQVIADSYYSLPVEPVNERENHPLYPTIIDRKNQIISDLNDAGLIPTFSEGVNPFIIQVPETAQNPLGFRRAEEGELILLTALLSGQLNGLGGLMPVPDEFVLTLDEIAVIRQHTNAFNEIIRDHQSGDIGLVETDELLEQVSTGLFQDGVTVNSDFITGGAFSLDAVHLTPRGYALVANAIIDEINSTFNARLSPVIINNHRAVVLP